MLYAAVVLPWLAVLIGALADEPAKNAQGVDSLGRAEEVSFSGRVIDGDRKAPVASATIVVARSLQGAAGRKAPAWVGETTLHSDADGRFTLTFPPEQVADPRLIVTFTRVSHSGFVPCMAYPVLLVSLLEERKYGDPPFFETITLERGSEYSGQVLTPERGPAADVPYDLENWAPGKLSPRFAHDLRGRTDPDGRFRVRMPKTQTLAIHLAPEAYAPKAHYWGTMQPAKHPDVWVPQDLGSVVLERGATINGRVLDLDGKPISGQRLETVGEQRDDRRTSTTGEDGRFSFAPLRPGTYQIVAEGQNHRPYFGLDEHPETKLGAVIRPAAVTVREGEAASFIELREMESVRVDVRLVDSQGRPARGGAVNINGWLPNLQPLRDDRPEAEKRAVAAKAEIAQPMGIARLDWGCQLAPGDDGRVTFSVPKGLKEARLETSPPNETIAYKARLEPGGPLKFWGRGDLGDLDSDRGGITILSYRAPTVLMTVETEDGSRPFHETSVHVGFISRGFSYGSGVTRQGDGRFRARLMPDHEYQLSAHAAGYVPSPLRRVNLREGAVEEMTLFIKPTPVAPRAGDPAPPFSVKTQEGRIVALDDFRGRFLLLHFWNPIFPAWHAGVPHVQKVQTQFGHDARLAILGLCMVDDPSDATKAVKDLSLAWPQAVLRDSSFDPMCVDYGVARFPRTILIGPGGKIVAADVKEDDIVKAVARALEAK